MPSGAKPLGCIESVEYMCATWNDKFFAAIRRGDDPFRAIDLADAWEEKRTMTDALQDVLKERKRQDAKWGAQEHDPITYLAILMEEVGEVARIMARQYGEQSFKKSDTEVNLADEMADVLFVLICLANQTGVDLTKAFQKNMKKKTLRDKDRHRNNPKLK